MDPTLAIVIAAVAIAACAYVAARHMRRAREAALELARQQQAALDALTPELLRLHDTLSTATSFDSGYLMKKDWDAICESAAPTLATLAEIPQSTIDASPQADQIATIRTSISDPAYRTTRNADYKAHELTLCDALLSDIDGGKSLDPQQRDAIVTDEYSNLVIAGAGSGKTSVVVGKVKYLVERWGVDPSDILVTSFTRASVADLKSRIEASGVQGVSAKTFHALGLNYLGNEYAVAAENALSRHVTSYLSTQLATHPDQASAFLEFFGLWSLTPDESQNSRSADLRMKMLKAQDMRTLKGLILESRDQAAMATFQGERVKSLEELMIANFLFLNGVEYEYERPYDHDIPDELLDMNRRAYQPDFYLPRYDIWFEHFGIDASGRPSWIATEAERQNYVDGMEWKRRVHEACGTRLIESYSYWNADHGLLTKVEELLTASGVELNNDPERNAELCGDLLRDERFFNSMAQLISTFISLVKSSNKTPAEVDDKARESYRGNGTMWHRYDLFTRFAWPIMESYQRSLSSGSKPRVDFDDMINRAAERIREEGYDKPYRYIIVDEYQDISLSRFGLLSAIRNATDAKLMCVGDDWQAIYRFAGSDVTLFTNFGKLVGHHEEMRIERTYRNSQLLVDAASSFILKNPDQLRKTVRSMAPEQPKPPIATISLEDQREALTFALNDLLSSPDGGGEIKVLGRNKRDLERIFPGLAPVGGFSFRKPKRGVAAEEKFDQVIRYSPDGKAAKEIGYMTVHKSKGLQADNVVVIGLVNDRYGFPNMVADDPILELLLADSDRYPFAEERRLFYVALTRTKNRVWLVTGEQAGRPGISRFVDEIARDNDESESFVFYCMPSDDEEIACPRCGGTLIRRSGPTGEFVGCSNYPFCDKTYRDTTILIDKRLCPACKGWMTRRTNSRDGSVFFGCTNYPRCQYTMNLDGTIGRLSGSTIPVSRESRSSTFIDYRKPRQASTRSRPSTAAPKCPKCGAPMRVRTSKYGKFYGCSRYPACKGKRDYHA